MSQSRVLILNVSPGGPITSLEEARDEIRRIRPPDGFPDGGVAIEIEGGTYELKDPLTLDERDSGTEASPIVYRSKPGEYVRLTGGSVVDGFEPVTDPEVLKRLAPEGREHVLQVDLGALRISDFGSPSGGGLELFYDDEPMTVARWPNSGFVKIGGLVGGDPVDVWGTKGDGIGKFHYEGDRPSRWDGEKDAWVHGYWFWDWADERQRIESIDTSNHVIALEQPYHRYGYRTGQWFYAFNLLSEIDTPGEWYLDRETGILYFWPPGPVDDGQAVVSVIDSHLEIEKAEYLRFEGIAFEASRKMAVHVSESSNVVIEACGFRNLGGYAVKVVGGANCTVSGCEITGTGEGGVHLTGGERKRLRPAGHAAEDNHIHHFSRWTRMYHPGISLNGVGLRAAHNLIHDTPHMAIFFSGNDHAIEYNEIHHVCMEANDAGAIYAGRDWTMRGTVIRHNFFHNILGYQERGCVGVYLDDMLCGTLVFGNLFYRVCRAAMIEGGRDCTIENNIFVDCDPALHIDARAMNWASYHVGTTMKDNLNEMPYREPIWVDRYPGLENVWEDEPAAPKGNLVARNIFLGGNWDGVREEARPYVTFQDNLVDQDVRFIGEPPADFRLQDDSPAFAVGFQRIPVEEIGTRE